MTHFRNTALALALTSLALTLASGCGGGSGSSEDKIAVTPVSITSFGASKTSLLYGERTTLSAVFSGGTGRVTPGDLAISSGTPLEVQPTATTTYSLTVTGGPGSTPQSRTVAVDVATVAVSTPSAGATQVEAGGSTTLSASVTGALDASITWTVSAGTITAGQGTGTITWTAPNSVQTATITATSTADPTKSASTQVQVVAVQVAPSNLTYPTVPRLYRGLGAPTLTPTVSGTAPMTFSVSPALPAGLALNTSTGAITGSPTEEAYGTYTITATNSVGSTSTQVVLEVGNPPLIFEVGTPRINRGSSTILSWNAASGEGVYDRVTLSASPEDPSLPTGTLPLDTVITVSPTAPSTTYTLTAHGLYGGSVSATQVIETSTAAATITELSGQDWATFGQPAKLSWSLGAGIPDTLTLNGENVLGQSSALVTPRRRQGYTLEARNAFGIDSKTFQVAARGLDTWAGQPLAFGHRDGAAEQARYTGISQVGPTAAVAHLTRDSAGNIYVPDNHTIRKIGIDGNVTTIAGTPGVTGHQDGPLAKFNQPHCAIVWLEDDNGNATTLYVSDTNNHVVRKVELTNNIWLTSTEIGTVGVSGKVTTQNLANPVGMAKQGSKLLIVDRANSNSAIRAYDPAAPAGERVTRIAGGADGTSATATGFVDGPGETALFNNPQAICVSAAGDVYVADSGNRAIRKIDQNGIVTTLAGGPGFTGMQDGPASEASFRVPSALALTAEGNLLISDVQNNSIRMLNMNTSTVSTLVGNESLGMIDGSFAEARFNLPQGMVHGTDGSLFVFDGSNAVIRRITAEAVESFSGRRWTGTTDGHGEQAKLAKPSMIVSGSNGDVYFTEIANRTVRKINSNREVTTIFASPDNGTPVSIAFDGKSNHIYVAISNVSPNKIMKINLADGTKTDLGIPFTTTARVQAITLTQDGRNIFVSESTPTPTIKKYDVETFELQAQLTSGAVNFGLSMETDSESIYWTTVGNVAPVIRRAPLDLSTAETVVGTTPGFEDGDQSTGKLGVGPNRMAVLRDEDGLVTGAWVADYGNNAIRYADFRSRTLWTLLGTPERNYAEPGAVEAASLNRPYALALTPQGDLLVTTSDAVMLVTLPVLP